MLFYFSALLVFGLKSCDVFAHCTRFKCISRGGQGCEPSSACRWIKDVENMIVWMGRGGGRSSPVHPCGHMLVLLKPNVTTEHALRGNLANAWSAFLHECLIYRVARLVFPSEHSPYHAGILHLNPLCGVILSNVNQGPHDSVKVHRRPCPT